MKEQKVIFKPFVWAVVAMDIIIVIVAAALRGRSVQYSYKYDNGNIICTNGLEGFLIPGYIFAGVALVLLIIALIQVIRFRKEMNLLVNLIVVIAFIPISLGLIHISVKSVVDVDGGYKSSCYEFTDTIHNIVVCEKYNDTDSYVEIYQVYNNEEVYFLGDYETLDGYTNKGNYKIEWLEEGFKIQFSIDGSGIELAYNVEYAK